MRAPPRPYIAHDVQTAGLTLGRMYGMQVAGSLPPLNHSALDVPRPCGSGNGESEASAPADGLPERERTVSGDYVTGRAPFSGCPEFFRCGLCQSSLVCVPYDLNNDKHHLNGCTSE